MKLWIRQQSESRWSRRQLVMFKPGSTYLIRMAARLTSWHLKAAEGCRARFLVKSFLRNQFSSHLSLEATIISPRTPRMYCFFLLCLSVSSGVTERDFSGGSESCWENYSHAHHTCELCDTVCGVLMAPIATIHARCPP